jgi:beta-N-acetylhexosaminidase
VTRAERARAAVVVLLCLLLAACSGSSARKAASGSPSPTTAPPPAPPSSSPAPSPPPVRARVDAAMARLDQRARVAQLFVVGVPMNDLGQADPLLAQGVGGIFLNARNNRTPATALAAVTRRWAGAEPVARPWVTLDQEGGLVQTLSGPGFGPLPSAREQGSLPPDRLAALADGMGVSLAGAGVNLDLAPVADAVPAGTEAGNAPIGAVDRQYGSTPDQVVAAAGAVVDGLAAHAVTATLKHFPGLGRVQQNTDTAAAVTDDVTTADDAQVAAFGALARRPGHPFVMMSSAVYSRIDPGQPAMFSPVVIGDVLRGRLGFDGVIISDDFAVTASVAAIPAGDRAVRFLDAGGTLVLIVQADPLQQMIDAVVQRSAADPQFAARVDDAVRTALTAKAQAGLLPG